MFLKDIIYEVKNVWECCINVIAMYFESMRPTYREVAYNEFYMIETLTITFKYIAFFV